MTEWLPPRWHLGALSKLTNTLETGSRPRGGVGGLAQGIPSIGAEHLDDRGGFVLDNMRFIPERFYQSMRRGHIHIGDILIAKDGATTGKVSFVQDDWPFEHAAVNEHVFILRPIPSANSSYIFFFLYSTTGQHQIKRTFHGSAQGGINQGFLEQVTVPLPPLPVQERIVAILQKADEIRRKRQQALQIADQILPALFIEMFGDPATNPKGWPVRKLADLLCELRNGTTAEQNTRGEGYPVTRIETISHGVIDPTRVRWVRLSPQTLEKWRLHDGDILFSHINSLEHIAKTALYRGQPPDLVHGMNLLLLRPNPAICLSQYLFVYLRLEATRQRMQGLARQAVNQASINQSQISGFHLPLPPLPQQQRFAEYASAFESVRAKLQASLRGAESAFNALLQQAFTGELTAEWEARNADWLAQRQAFYERLPQH